MAPAELQAGAAWAESLRGHRSPVARLGQRKRVAQMVLVGGMISIYMVYGSVIKKIIQHRRDACASGSRRSLQGKMAAKAENRAIQLNMANFV